MRRVIDQLRPFGIWGPLPYPGYGATKDGEAARLLAKSRKRFGGGRALLLRPRQKSGTGTRRGKFRDRFEGRGGSDV